nr:MAG TPA: hypothetical protein [Caudoviricetes sp.]
MMKILKENGLKELTNFILKKLIESINLNIILLGIECFL